MTSARENLLMRQVTGRPFDKHEVRENLIRRLLQPLKVVRNFESFVHFFFFLVTCHEALILTLFQF